MKANELRIGNYVSSIEYKGNWTVVATDEYGLTCYEDNKDYRKLQTIKGWQPIKLTEEWLVRFGFEVDNDNTDEEFTFMEKCLENGDKVILTKYQEESHYEPFGFLRKIEYVHQLQNLYFALTGEELETSN